MSTLYPDVPLAPGVPPVFRGPVMDDDQAAGTDLSASNTLTTDAIAKRGVSPAAWGFYNDLDNTPTIVPDSLVKLEPRRAVRVSDYPVEGGGFQTYNKVQTPLELRVTVTKGGSDSDRAAFILEMDALLISINLFHLVTPDSAFQGYTLTDYDYSRSADRGVTLLTFDLELLEVRQTAVGAFSLTKSPSGTDPVDGGPVRAATPTPAQVPPGFVGPV